jgi:hypothetical protein
MRWVYCSHCAEVHTPPTCTKSRCRHMDAQLLARIAYPNRQARRR